MSLDSGSVQLILRIGKNVPEPAPALLMNAVQKVVVATSDTVNNTGFQIVFSVGHGNATNPPEYPLLSSPLIKPFNRVIIMVSFGVTSKVLIDGIITSHQFNPSFEPGKSTFTITGLDLSVIMSLEEKKATSPNQSDADIVSRLISIYAKYGLKSKVVAPESMEKPMKNVSVAHRTASSDLQYICQLANKYQQWVFFIEPTDVVGENIAYWGPRDHEGVPQKKELSFNMGEFSNVTAIDFEMNVLKQSKVEDKIQDNNAIEDVKSSSSEIKSKLAAQLVVNFNKEMQVIKKFRGKSGISLSEAYNRAQEEAIRASSDAVTVMGELDSIRYGDVLRAGHLAKLRGVGQSYNGLYYVRQVTHTITKGSYKQKFTLTREGIGTTIQKV